jgi:hypothetical protein
MDSKRFREMALAKRTRELVEVLQAIEPRLRDIEALPAPSGMRLYGDIGLPRLVLLGDMGGGINRLTSLALALWNSQSGTVLIDEVENGLHHAVLRSVWRIIGEAARRFDVQVFATTHSMECIAAAHEAFTAACAEDFRVHRLQRLRDRVHHFIYDEEGLRAALETGLEVR